MTNLTPEEKICRNKIFGAGTFTIENGDLDATSVGANFVAEAKAKALQAAKDELGVKSPSRKMMTVSRKLSNI